jgi:carbamoyl-phosphate synthase large subunit
MGERPILVDRFLQNAIEAEAGALSDGADTFVPAAMEHIELAGNRHVRRLLVAL